MNKKKKNLKKIFFNKMLELEPDFKQKLSDLLKDKSNIYPINTNKIIYTNGTGLMPYKNPRWFSDIYYYCSKMLYEQPKEDTLNITFYAGGNNIRVKHCFYSKDITNLLSLFKQRFIDCPNEHSFLESCINDIEEYSINFKFI